MTSIQQAGPLRVWVIEPTSQTNEPPLSIVLCHGFGAPGHDLVPLHRVIAAPSNTRWFFLEAPLELDGMPGARAWWLIDMIRLQMALFKGQYRSLSTETPQGLFEARDKLSECIEVLKKKYDIQPGKLVVGGFSQGAMLSVEYALFGQTNVAGLLLMSGALLSEERWRIQATTRANKLKVFQSHGTYDPILPFVGAEMLRDLLVKAGALVTWYSFDGQHEIPMGAVSAIGGFLTTI